MTILVTGGCGYIGSVTVEALRQRGNRVVVVDDLSRGHRQAVAADVPFYTGQVGDGELIRGLIAQHGIDACIHFAALTYVGESVQEPERYYANNVGATMGLLDALVSEGVRRFVFSSTCATYGEPQRVPIDESNRQQPESPYGWGKLFVEQTLASFGRSYGFGHVALRYFNAAGATAQRGEDHDPESHLIPLALQAALGQRPGLTVFGDDYPTPDGTCIRDYVHVADLAQAHLLALDHLAAGGESCQLNLGTGRGYSVREVIDTAQGVTGQPIASEIGPRRAGDTSRLVADASRALQVLGWRPQIPDLERIVATAWAWHRAHPHGYEDDR
jgi:UDP-glucose 4-epimerase